MKNLHNFDLRRQRASVKVISPKAVLVLKRHQPGAVASNNRHGRVDGNRLCLSRRRFFVARSLLSLKTHMPCKNYRKRVPAAFYFLPKSLVAFK